MELGGPMRGKCSSMTMRLMIMASRPWSAKNMAKSPKRHMRKKTAHSIIKVTNLFFLIHAPMSFKRFIPYFTLLFIVLTSTLLVWMPFILKTSNFLTIYKNFDGPNYIIAAKSMYVPKDIEAINRDSSLSQNPLYFTAHLPLYPVLIRLASPLFGYLKSMLVVNIFFTGLLAMFFYFFLKKLNLTKHPLLIASLFLFLPRFLVVRSVGAPESLF